MNKSIVIVGVLCGLCFSQDALATVRNSNTGTINQMNAYDTYGGGDVVIWFSTGVSGCTDGVYIDPAASGFETIVSLALAAYLSGRTIRFAMYDDREWAGSGDDICEVQSISLL